MNTLPCQFALSSLPDTMALPARPLRALAQRLSWSMKPSTTSEGTSGASNSTLLRRMAVQFGRSFALYTAADAAGAVVASQDSPLLVKAGYPAACFGAVLAGERIMKLFQSPLGAPVKALGAAAQLPFRLCLPTQLAASALAGYASYKLGFVHSAHEQRLQAGEWEEVPLSGRRRPAMPAVTGEELKNRSLEAIDVNSCAALGTEGYYYPADHPLTLKAQSGLGRLLPAALSVLKERHGSSSEVVQQAREHFDGWVPPVMVYHHFETSTMAGFAGPGFIAIRDTELGTPDAVHTLAHELGHTICRHVQEEAHMEAAFQHSLDMWSRASCVGHIMIAGQRSLPVFLSMTAFTIIRNSYLKTAHLEAAPPTAIDSAGAASEGHEEASVPLLAPHQPGFHARHSLSREIVQELEAERMSMFIMARAGYTPFLAAYSYGGLDDYLLKHLIRRAGDPDRVAAILISAFAEAAEADPAKLTTIAASERDGWGIRGWPNAEKLLALYAEVLPPAMAVYRAHCGPQSRIRWLAQVFWSSRILSPVLT